MKRALIVALFLIAIAAVAAGALSITVTSRQGIDYITKTIRIPLYLKVLDFYDRHYNYKWLVKTITAGQTDDLKKAISILQWSHANVAEQPKGLRVVDDHVWHIIVRGYGLDEQVQDVFSTLCNYAGLPAFCARVGKTGSTRVLSFVRLNGRWTVFDAAKGVYFAGPDGGVADVKDVEAGNFTVVGVDGSMAGKLGYENILSELRFVDYNSWRRSRPGIQSPAARLIFGLGQK